MNNLLYLSCCNSRNYIEVIMVFRRKRQSATDKRTTEETESNIYYNLGSENVLQKPRNGELIPNSNNVHTDEDVSSTGAVIELDTHYNSNENSFCQLGQVTERPYKSLHYYSKQGSNSIYTLPDKTKKKRQNDTEVVENELYEGFH